MRSLPWIIASILLVSIASAQLTDAFGEADKAQFTQFLNTQKGGNYGSLKDTYNTVVAATLLKVSVPSKSEVVSYASKALSAAKSVEEVHYASAILSSLGALTSPSKETTKLVSSGLESADLYNNFHAIKAVEILKPVAESVVNKKAIQSLVEQVADLSAASGEFFRTAESTESSIFNTAVAVSTVSTAAQLSPDVSKASVTKVAKELETLTQDFYKEKYPVFSFSDESASTLETTSLLLDGGLKLSGFLGRPLFTPAQVNKLGAFFAQFKTLYTPSQALSFAVGAAKIAVNDIASPVAVTVTPSVLTADASAGKKVQVHVTDILGNVVPAKVQLTSATYGKAIKSVVSAQDLVFSNGAHQLDLLSGKPEKGLVTLNLKVTPTGDSAVSAFTATPLVKIVSPIALKDIVAEVSTGKSSTTQTFEASKTAPKAVVAQQGDRFGNTVKVSFVAQNTFTGKPTTVHQAVLRLTTPTGAKLLFPLSSSADQVYSVTLDLTNDKAVFSSESGKYIAELLVGDVFASNSFAWTLGTFDLTFKDAPTAVATEQLAFLQPKPVIEHKFRVPDARPSDKTAYFFTLATLAPFAIFLLGLPVLKANLSLFPGGITSLYALGFIAGLGGLLATIVHYWVELNMFQALGRLGVIAVPTLFFGQRVLRYMSGLSHKAKSD